MCVGVDGFWVGKPRWHTYGYVHQEPTRFQLYGPYVKNMWDRCVLVLMGSWWARPDGIEPTKFQVRWDTHGKAHPKPTKPITHGPHIKKWDRCVLKLMGLLVGNTRWDTYGCAHQNPIRFETYGPHLEKMWGRCVLVLMGFGWASPDGTLWVRPSRTHKVSAIWALC